MGVQKGGDGQDRVLFEVPRLPPLPESLQIDSPGLFGFLNILKQKKPTAKATAKAIKSGLASPHIKPSALKPARRQRVSLNADAEKPIYGFEEHVEPELGLWLGNGIEIRSLKELYDALGQIDDSIFSYHVNSKKNEFGEWVRDVVGNHKLAEKLNKAREKQEFIKILEESKVLPPLSSSHGRLAEPAMAKDAVMGIAPVVPRTKAVPPQESNYQPVQITGQNMLPFAKAIQTGLKKVSGIAWRRGQPSSLSLGTDKEYENISRKFHQIVSQSSKENMELEKALASSEPNEPLSDSTPSTDDSAAQELMQLYKDGTIIIGHEEDFKASQKAPGQPSQFEGEWAAPPVKKGLPKRIEERPAAHPSFTSKIQERDFTTRAQNAPRTQKPSSLESVLPSRAHKEKIKSMLRQARELIGRDDMENYRKLYSQMNESLNRVSRRDKEKRKLHYEILEVENDRRLAEINA